MSWKGWPYWIKGSVIGGAFYILVTIILSLFTFLFGNLFTPGLGGFSAFRLILIFYISTPGAILIGSVFNYNILDTGEAGLILSVGLTLLLSSLIGAIIGLIYSKFKGRTRYGSKGIPKPNY